MMKLLLTSSGVSNRSIHHAVIELLDKPLAESNAIFVPTGIYLFSAGVAMAYEAICGEVSFQMEQAGMPCSCPKSKHW